MHLLNASVPVFLAPSGSLQAVVLDWAGTTVDFGSLAPVRTLQKVFFDSGISIADDWARRDMGVAKREHLSRLLSMTEVRKQWQERHGSEPGADVLDRLFSQFTKLQMESLVEYSGMIPGVVEAVSRARKRGLAIGSTTGYTREMLAVLVDHAAAFGYRTDCSVCPEDVGAGRPKPFMMWEVARRLEVFPMAGVVKVGDTPADIEEALNAGAWSVGVAGSGNMIGLSLPDFEALPVQSQQELLRSARARLERSGAHFVIDGVAELDGVLDRIDSLLLHSERLS